MTRAATPLAPFPDVNEGAGQGRSSRATREVAATYAHIATFWRPKFFPGGHFGAPMRTVGTTDDNDMHPDTMCKGYAVSALRRRQGAELDETQAKRALRTMTARRYSVLASTWPRLISCSIASWPHMCCKGAGRRRLTSRKQPPNHHKFAYPPVMLRHANSRAWTMLKMLHFGRPRARAPKKMVAERPTRPHRTRRCAGSHASQGPDSCSLN